MMTLDSRFLINSLQMLLYSEHSHKTCSTDSHSQKNALLLFLVLCLHRLYRNVVWCEYLIQVKKGKTFTKAVVEFSDYIA